ncbi:thiamine diphosphate-binding protein [Acaromyces ingoldii]|uniref:2-oxoisovalerate dehydrogenase subunit alpha n=1 Tax=Acaromyces ingoldii TaxID=215250 RepID=A0A316YUT8_9BASI|nr:thiamine diphosphate-binding protein [Acaromyces ingoldii]PWN93039.1 thiamine diphosphate-binding protein [Acaromyces ingoldii]
MPSFSRSDASAIKTFFHLKDTSPPAADALLDTMLRGASTVARRCAHARVMRAPTAAMSTSAIRLSDSSSSSSSNSSSHLPGYPSSPFLSSLKDSIFDSVRTSTSPANNPSKSSIPTFRLLDSHGSLLEGVSEESLELTKEEAVKMYEHMLLLPALDVILYNAQRQGRISFMMTSHGEEAAIIGSASGLGAQDEVFAQYREMGVLLWRGFSLDQVMSQVGLTIKSSSCQSVAISPRLLLV